MLPHFDDRDRTGCRDELSDEVPILFCLIRFTPNQSRQPGKAMQCLRIIGLCGDRLGSTDRFIGPQPELFVLQRMRQRRLAKLPGFAERFDDDLVRLLPASRLLAGPDGPAAADDGDEQRRTQEQCGRQPPSSALFLFLRVGQLHLPEPVLQRIEMGVEQFDDLGSRLRSVGGGSGCRQWIARFLSTSSA